MTRALSRAIRRIVIAALAPASALGCGNSRASSVIDGGTSSPTGCSSPANLSNHCAALSGQPNCTPSAYVDGGVGPCASHWIQGDGCCGGSVLFPCGLPPNMQEAYTCSNGACVQSGTTANERFAPYCMGSDLFNGAYATDLDGGSRAWFKLAADGSFEEQPDSAAIVYCYYDCTGRRPATLIAGTPRHAETTGDALARAAYLEEASVAAFLDLAAQLEAHRAPRQILRALRRQRGMRYVMPATSGPSRAPAERNRHRCAWPTRDRVCWWIWRSRMPARVVCARRGEPHAQSRNPCERRISRSGVRCAPSRATSSGTRRCPGT